MNVTILGFGFSMTSPVAWMRFTGLFGVFFFLGQRKRMRCWWPGGRGGRDECYDTGIWIFSDQSSCLDEIN